MTPTYQFVEVNWKWLCFFGIIHFIFTLILKMTGLVDGERTRLWFKIAAKERTRGNEAGLTKCLTPE